MKTAIFDMDGLLINSEPMWKHAEKQVFTSLGVEVSNTLSAKTATMTTREVTEFWFNQTPWQNQSLEQVENDVVDYVESLIRTEGIAMPGVHEILELLHSHQFKIGLATNSPSRLIPVVLNALNITDFFHSLTSSEHVTKGKPHPAVYLSTLTKLEANPAQTFAIEDSVSGFTAAKAANLKTVVVPCAKEYDRSEFDMANLKLRSLKAFNDKHLNHLFT